VNPQRLWANSGARAGDHLVLTKRLGTGIIGTAIKQGAARDEAIQAAVHSMCMLNRAASEVALTFPVHGATDITGFGLLGHVREMAIASRISLVLDHTRIAFLPGALEYSRQGFIPGGLKRIIEFMAGWVEIADGISDDVRNLLFDPQTSGGMLFSVERGAASELMSALRERGVPAQEVGEVEEKTHPLIRVR
jgi:selenide,water dikinase